MGMNLLVDSDEFWEYLQKDLSASKQSVWIQTFSLEGDWVGKALSRQISGLRAPDIKIIVDSFGKWVINDKYLFFPHNLIDPELRRELKSTLQLIDSFRQDGVQVKFTNPVGFLFTRFMTRNHKKLILIDDRLAYIGGINFSEHNFSWHDIMLRIEGHDVVGALAQDFLSTWRGNNSCKSIIYKNIEIYFLDGYSNKVAFGNILKLIEGAQAQIIVQSPYLSFPFCDSLRLARKRGVAVTIIAPESNNMGLVKEYLIEEAAKFDFELRLYSKGMTHLKAILIDNRYLVMGSSNFDYLSYRLHQEIVAVITEPEVISEFVERVIREDLKNSRVVSQRVGFLRKHILNWMLKFLAMLIAEISISFRR
jgi:cardiolipin synthase